MMPRVVAPLATLMTVRAAVVGIVTCVAGWWGVWSGLFGWVVVVVVARLLGGRGVGGRP